LGDSPEGHSIPIPHSPIRAAPAAPTSPPPPERSAEISRGLPALEDGWIPLPTAAGLSIDLDEAALARYPGRVYPTRSIRQSWQESEAAPAYS
jgi:hypothetical protein